jgi:hypothetical protein
MTAKQVFDEILALTATHILRIQSGEITQVEANDEMEELLMRARLSLSDEELVKIRGSVLSIHDVIARDIKSSHGVSVPGNDPSNPN